MASWFDKMISRVRAAPDSSSARAIVADYIDPATGETRNSSPDDDGDTHIHVHMPGSKEDKMNDDETDPVDLDNESGTDVAQLAARIASLEEQVQALMANEEEEVELEDPSNSEDARRFKMRRGSKLKRVGDEDMPVPEHRDDIMGETDLPGIEDLDKRMPTAKVADAKRNILTRDSADMEETWREALANAEIIVPGFKMPSFDARLPVSRTAERLCSLRRRVLDSALRDEEVSQVVASLIGIKTADGIKHLRCDSVKMAFNATAAAMRSTNNARNIRGAAAHVSSNSRTGDNSKVPTIGEIQKRNQEYWEKQRGNGARR